MSEESKTGPTGGRGDAPPHETQGVQELIDRLRHEGVEEGRARAQQIVEEAERRAAWTVTQAEEEAERLKAEARGEAERLRAAADQAIRAAGRDAVLDLKAELTARFSTRVEHLVGREVADMALLRDLILAAASRVRDDQRLDAAGRLKALLPHESVDLAQLRRDQEHAGEDELSRLVLGLASEDLRDGVEIGIGEHGRGIRLQLVDSQVTIDLTDEAVADLLLEHLLPRFRALLEGIVR
jgi:V/A-type H+-transporting ATPase subunit E